MNAASKADLWFLSRSTGMVCLLLMTASVVIGIVIHRRRSLPLLPDSALVGWHRNLSLVTLVFLGLHIVSALADPYVTIGWFAAVVPFISPYETVWIGIGALAFDLLLVVIASSLVRRFIGGRMWRAIHLSTYACWPIAAAHGIGAASDLRSGFQLALTIACGLAILVAAGFRVRAWRIATPRAARVLAEMGR